MPQTWTSPSAQDRYGYASVALLDVLPQATTPGADTRPKATALSETFMVQLREDCGVDSRNRAVPGRP